MRKDRVLVRIGVAAFLGLLGWAVLSGPGGRKARRAQAAKVPAADPRGVDGSGRTPAENEAIAEVLRSLPKDAVPLRTAEDTDGTESDARRDLDSLYADYHPFFVRGDLDGDGRLDFVQAFVERGKGTAWFHVAVFFGTQDGKFGRPVWVERSISLSAGDISIERSLLIVTPDLDVDQARRWRFEPVTRRFADADVARPETPAEDEGDETAAQKA